MAQLKKLIIIFFLGIAIGATGFFALQNNPAVPTTGLVPLTNSDSVQPFFCPADSCANQLTERIGLADQQIDIAIYSFTSEEISDALIAAHQKGIKLRVVFDAGQAKSQYSADEKLENAGIQIRRLDLSRGILHDKFAVIDGKTVATGSFNYSNNADQYNRENLVFIQNSKIAAQYEAEFESLWSQAG